VRACARVCAWNAYVHILPFWVQRAYVLFGFKFSVKELGLRPLHEFPIYEYLPERNEPSDLHFLPSFFLFLSLFVLFLLYLLLSFFLTLLLVFLLPFILAPFLFPFLFHYFSLYSSLFLCFLLFLFNVFFLSFFFPSFWSLYTSFLFITRYPAI